MKNLLPLRFNIVLAKYATIKHTNGSSFQNNIGMLVGSKSAKMVYQIL